MLILPPERSQQVQSYCHPVLIQNWFNIPLSSSGSRTSTGDGCLLHLEPRASDLKPIKKMKIRRLLSTLLVTDSDILQMPCTREEALYCAVSRNSAELTQRVDPNLAMTFQVDKQTTLCTCPLLRHTPTFAVDGKPAAHLWFCCGWLNLNLTTTLSPSSST